jgi:hypothetical protein
MGVNKIEDYSGCCSSRNFINQEYGPTWIDEYLSKRFLDEETERNLKELYSNLFFSSVDSLRIIVKECGPRNIGEWFKRRFTEKGRTNISSMTYDIAKENLKRRILMEKHLC